MAQARFSLWIATLAFVPQLVTALVLLLVVSGAQPYQYGWTRHRLGRNVLLGVLAWLVFMPWILTFNAVVTEWYQNWLGRKPEPHELERLAKGNPNDRAFHAAIVWQVSREPGGLVPLLLAISRPDQEATLQALLKLSLTEIGAEAAPELSKLLMAGEEATRREAIRTITLIGPEVRATVPPLVKVLEDRSSPLRVDCIRALAAMGPSARPAVPAVVAGRRCGPLRPAGRVRQRARA